jgi:hypothetical protein
VHLESSGSIVTAGHARLRPDLQALTRTADIARPAEVKRLLLTVIGRHKTGGIGVGGLRLQEHDSEETVSHEGRKYDLMKGAVSGFISLRPPQGCSSTATSGPGNGLSASTGTNVTEHWGVERGTASAILSSNENSTLNGRTRMIRLIAVLSFALAVATSAQAVTPAPIHQPNGMITQVAFGCGPGRTLVNGVCVARTTIRQTRRCVRWQGSACVLYH